MQRFHFPKKQDVCNIFANFGMSMVENGHLLAACYHFEDQQNVTSLLLKSIVQSFFHKEITRSKRDYWF